MRHSHLLPVVVTFLLVGSSARAADPAKPAKVTYDDHILPILRDKCVACHDPDKQKGGLVLNNYTRLMEGGSTGAVVKAGDPDGSRLYVLTAHKDQPRMPPRSPMIAKESLDLIEAWIRQGALENAGSQAVPLKPKTDVALASIVRGKPEGPPPMPEKPLRLEPVVRTGRASAVTALACNPWSPLVAVGGQKQVLLYHTEALELLGVLPFPEGTPHVLKFSRNGSLLLAGGGHDGKSGRVVVWNVKTGERVVEVGDESDCVLAADISADQTQIALGGPGKMIRIYSTRDGTLLRAIKKHTDWVYAVEYSPDGVLLATGDRTGGLFIWEAHTGREYFALRGHTAAVNDVSWRSDSNVLASAGEDGTIRLWEMENGSQIKAWSPGGGVQAVKYAHDGRIASCGRDRVVKIWDGNGGQQRALEPFADVALRVAFGHDGARVIGCDWTGQVRVFMAADGKLTGNLSVNPPSLGEQLEAAEKNLAALQAGAEQSATAAAASQATAQKAAAELAGAQKALADAGAAVKQTGEALAKAGQDSAAADAAVRMAQQQIAARDVLARALAEASAKVKDAADRAKDNQEMAAAAAKAQALATQATAELAAAQKTFTESAATARSAAEQLAKATQGAAQATAAADAASKLVPTRTAELQAATAKAAADRAAAERNSAALTPVRARVDRLKAALAVVKQPQK